MITRLKINIKIKGDIKMKLLNESVFNEVTLNEQTIVIDYEKLAEATLISYTDECIAEGFVVDTFRVNDKEFANFYVAS